MRLCALHSTAAHNDGVTGVLTGHYRCNVPFNDHRGKGKNLMTALIEWHRAAAAPVAGRYSQAQIGSASALFAVPDSNSLL